MVYKLSRQKEMFLTFSVGVPRAANFGGGINWGQGRRLGDWLMTPLSYFFAVMLLHHNPFFLKVLLWCDSVLILYRKYFLFRIKCKYLWSVNTYKVDVDACSFVLIQRKQFCKIFEWQIVKQSARPNFTWAFRNRIAKPKICDPS